MMETNIEHTERDIDKMKENQAGHRNQYNPDQIKREWYEVYNSFSASGSGEWTGAHKKVMYFREFENGVVKGEKVGVLKQSSNQRFYWKFKPAPELQKALIAAKLFSKDEFETIRRS